MKTERNRKPNRLSNFDYSQNGMYFVTICTKEKEELFGEIKDNGMVLNELGKIVKNNLTYISDHFENIFLDKYVVMPNHIHIIFEIINKNDVGTDLVSVQKQTQGQIQDLPLQNNEKGQTQGLSLRKINFGLLSKVVQVFKSKSAVEYIQLMKSKNTACITKIWQRSFHDHIIRNEIELKKIREYIINNPKNWEQDRNNSENLWM
jgi:putative transposase